MKKILNLILITLLVLTLIGCSQGKVNQEKSLLSADTPQKVTIWHYYTDDGKMLLDDLITEFNGTVGMEKGVYVEAVNKGTIQDLESAVTNSAKGVINSEPLPSIFSSYIDKALEIYEMGKLVNLDEYLTKEQKSKFVKDFLDAGYSDGKLLTLPIAKSSEVLFINKTAWEEYKAESGFTDEDLSTWEGICKVSKKYFEDRMLLSNKRAHAFFGMDDLPNYVIIGNRQNGVELVNGKDKNAILDKTAMKKVFDVYFDSMMKGYFYESGKYRTTNVKSQDIVGYIGSTSGAAYFPTAIEDNGTRKNIDLLVLPYPHFENGEACNPQQGAGMSVVKSSPEEIEASLLFLDWFTEKRQNLDFSTSTGYLPVNKDVYKSDIMENRLKEMEKKDKGNRNIAAVYRVAIAQLMDAKSEAYASKPFKGSYSIREVTSNTLRQITYDNLGKKEDPNFKVNSDEAFNQWLSDIKIELDKRQIKYEER